jgi:hypothetical protein
MDTWNFGKQTSCLNNNCQKMILRIRTPEGALRLEVDPVKDQTIQHLMNKVF